MTDGFDALLAGLAAPRPLPDDARRRLETALLARSQPAVLDAPRALPEGIDTILMSDFAAAGAAMRDGIDAPRPIPAQLAARLERRLLAADPVAGAPALPLRSRWRPVRIAAIVLLLVGLSSVTIGPVTRPVGGGSTATMEEAGTADTAGGEVLDDGVVPDGTGGSEGQALAAGAPTGTTTPRPGGRVAGASPGTRSGVADGGGTIAAGASPVASAARSRATAAAVAATTRTAGPPPPYSFPGSAAGTGPAGGAPLKVGVITGDRAQEAGARAYVDLTNRQGGVRGRPLQLVEVRPSAPATGVVATLNLSGVTVAPSAWAGVPLLETLPTNEPALRKPTYDFASPPERQAHLVVDAVFPSASPTSTALVVSSSTGPFAAAVADALVAALRARQVTVLRSSYQMGQTVLFQPTDSAFLSLGTEDARGWLRQARAAGFRPARGVAGVYSLYDETLLPDLPDGARLVSPFRLPGADETKAIRAGATLPVTAAVLHGWATAKSLAVALWQSGAVTSSAAVVALDDLEGYASSLAPPYEVRPGTTSRTPEAVLYRVANGAFNLDGDFRRDPQ